MQRSQFNDLALPHLNAAYNLARYLVRDPSHAEDIVQDAYVRALSAFNNFRGGDAKAWLLTIVRNCCMTWLSKHSQDQQRLSDSTMQNDEQQS
ncbi:MAG TPA: sigma-70 family RNA polymerase sigma factor, partial [Steroidobacteraceae bacterium]|nr:sigma-70 family RNA polymerase sigma factor [Steroidobacteraceae bacterium]